MTYTLVPAKVVRAWYNELPEDKQATIVAPGKRGRLDSNTVEAFNKAHTRNKKRYVPASDAQKRDITVKVTSLNKNGIKCAKNVTMLTEQAREVLGHHSGKRGRFNKEELSLALSAIEANKFANQFRKV